MDVLKEGLILTGYTLFLLLVPGLVLAYLMNVVAGRVEHLAYQLMGRRIFLFIFGWLGTMIHELGHAVMCLVFGHRIKEMVLFDPSKAHQHLGYVQHSYNPRNPYHLIGNFFIGIGPIVFGVIVIYAAGWLLLSEHFLASFQAISYDHRVLTNLDAFYRLGQQLLAALERFSALFVTSENLGRWQFYLFLYILFSVGSSIKLSKADIRGAFSGLLALIVLLSAFCFVLILFKDGIAMETILRISNFFSPFFILVIFVLLLNGLLLVPLWVAVRLFGR